MGENGTITNSFKRTIGNSVQPFQTHALSNEHRFIFMYIDILIKELPNISLTRLILM